jgi:hypothetical protein
MSSGCALHIHREIAPPPGFKYDSSLPADERFEERNSLPVELSEPIDSTLQHEVLRLSYPSSGTNGHPQNRVEGQYFRSRDSGPKPLVVVMPIWGTSSYPPAKISSGYARRAGRDTHVIWIYGSAPLFPWDELSSVPVEADFMAMARDSAERYRSSVVDMRRLIDWAITRDEIDSTRIAFVGFSMSALVTATLLANDSRIAAGVLMMGAANFADIFAVCGNRAGEVRNHVVRTFGWSIDRYDPDRILMIDAMFDDCMPESSRAALWEVTGHPERITLLFRHRSAFYSLTPLGLNFSRRRIYQFLDDTLRSEPRRAATSRR